MRVPDVPAMPSPLPPRPAWEKEHLDADGLPSLPPPDFPAHHDEEEQVESVRRVPRRQVSPGALKLVGGLVAVAALLAAFGAVRAMNARQERAAEEAREHEQHLAAMASETAKVAAVPSMPAPPPVAPAPAPAPPESASAVAEPEPAPAASPPVAAQSAPAEPQQQAAAPVPHEGAAAAPAPAHPAGPSREMPLDVGPGVAGASLISQANRAMAKGDVNQALELARQAVASNPANADTWLTLGAAYQAAGNPSAARDAYRSCIKQAHSASVSDCRVLAGR
jgi:hypothetical protein